MITIQRVLALSLLLLIPFSATSDIKKSEDESRLVFESGTDLYTISFPSTWNMFPEEVVKKIQKETGDFFPVEAAFYMNMDEENYTCPCAWLGLFKAEELPRNIPLAVRMGNLEELPLERAFGEDHVQDLGDNDENIFYDSDLKVVWMRWEDLNPEGSGTGYRRLFVAAPTSSGVIVGIRFESTPMMFDASSETFRQIVSSLNLTENTIWRDYKKNISNPQVMDAVHFYRAPAIQGTLLFMVMSALLGLKLRDHGFAFKLCVGAFLTALVAVVGCSPAIFAMLDKNIPDTALGMLLTGGMLKALILPTLVVGGAALFKNNRNLVGLTNAWMCGAGLVVFASCWGPYAFIWDLLFR